MSRDSFPIVPNYKSGVTPIQAHVDAFARAAETLCRSLPKDNASYREVIALLDDQRRQVTEYFYDVQR